MIDTRELENIRENRTSEPVPKRLRPFIIQVTGRLLPTQLIGRWVEAASRRARFEKFSDGTWYAEVPGATGAWANEATEDATDVALRKSLTGWVILKIEDRDRDIPSFGGIDLNVL